MRKEWTSDLRKRSDESIRQRIDLDALSRWIRLVMMIFVSVVTVDGTGCALHRHRIDFAPLETADRIEVMDTQGGLITVIRVQSQIASVEQFIKKYESGWEDPLAGPLVPRIFLNFYRGDRSLGGFGIGGHFIMSDPSTEGFWSRPVPEAEIKALLRTLGLPETIARPKA